MESVHAVSLVVWETFAWALKLPSTKIWLSLTGIADSVNGPQSFLGKGIACDSALWINGSSYGAHIGAPLLEGDECVTVFQGGAITGDPPHIVVS